MTRRSGFTLLEMLLASGIAMLLMAGLYVAMDVNLYYAAAGREVVDESQLARSLMNRIASDVASALTPITATKSTTTATPATSTATTPATGTATGATGTGTATGTADDTSTPSLTIVQPLNKGVVGDGTLMTLYVSRVPKWPTNMNSGNSDQSFGASDLHRISYWMSTAGDGGLARQDLDRVTADDDDAQLPPGLSNEDRMIVAPEVTGLQFRYFDGTTWQETWDGSIIGDDGATPIGPPRAIEIRLDIRKPGAPVGDTTHIRSYRHVVAIGTANGMPAATTDTTGTTASTTTGGGP